MTRAASARRWACAPEPARQGPAKKPPRQTDLERSSDWMAAAGQYERASLEDLRRLWLAAFGTPTTSTSATYLRRRLVHQALLGATTRTGDQPRPSATALAPAAPTARRRPPAAVSSTETTPSGTTADPRRPPLGSVLRRQVGAELHEVVVHAETFEYRGQPYKSLSAIAFEVTGTHWNGWTFFGLKTRTCTRPPSMERCGDVDVPATAAHGG